jgi:hypothetical protein
MFDVNQNAIPDDATEPLTPEGGDAPLLQACEDFFKINKLWLEANPEGGPSKATCLSSEEHLQLALDRQEALHEVIRSSPTGCAGLWAKYEVLQELRRLGEEDSPGLLTFAETLVDEYHRFSLKARIFPAVIEDRKPRWFNLNLFGMFCN